jgi:UPF0755 protein
MKKFLLWIILLGGLYLGARIAMVWNTPNSDSSDRISIEIKRGASLQQISELLFEKNLIRDAWVFELFAKWNRLSTKFQAGEFIIQKNLTFSEIAEILQHGKGKEIKITIPEGYTIDQIDEMLSKKSLIKSGEFKKCTNLCNFSFSIASLEGYLYPSTYYVNPEDFSVRSFIIRLYRTFRQEIASLQSSLQDSQRTLDEIVIMASMIEREAFDSPEMPIISGILWKRLDESIPLGVDATTRYELNNWKRPLYTQDFEKDSPYNTRRRQGLPPTAISNPSIESLRAALAPTETEYYYYLHDSKGQIRYARNLNEHVKNKEKYLY